MAPLDIAQFHYTIRLAALQNDQRLQQAERFYAL
jgi:hypothetical protein